MRIHAGLPAVAALRRAADTARRVLSAHRAGVRIVQRQSAHGLQHVDLLVAQLLGLVVDQRLHRDQAQQLQQVILHHVAQRARAVVIATAGPHPVVFRHRDLHVIDVAAVPDRLEQRVGEAQRQDVLHRLLAEIVIDAVDLAFVEHLAQLAIQRGGGRQVAPERLLHHDAIALALLRHPGRAQPRGDQPEHIRRRREVEHARRRRAEILLGRVDARREGGVGRVLVETAAQVFDLRHETRPLRGIGAAATRMRRHRLLDLAAERILLAAARHADDQESLRHVAVEVQVVQRRQQLAPREIARGAKDRDHHRSLHCHRRIPVC